MTMNTMNIFLCKIVKKCSGARTYSHHKRIKKELRTTTTTNTMCFENDILQKTDVKDIIKQFARLKSQKNPFQTTKV